MEFEPEQAAAGAPGGDEHMEDRGDDGHRDPRKPRLPPRRGGKMHKKGTCLHCEHPNANHTWRECPYLCQSCQTHDHSALDGGPATRCDFLRQMHPGIYERHDFTARPREEVERRVEEPDRRRQQHRQQQQQQRRRYDRGPDPGNHPYAMPQPYQMRYGPFEPAAFAPGPSWNERDQQRWTAQLITELRNENAALRDERDEVHAWGREAERRGYARGRLEQADEDEAREEREFVEEMTASRNTPPWGHDIGDELRGRAPNTTSGQGRVEDRRSLHNRPSGFNNRPDRLSGDARNSNYEGGAPLRNDERSARSSRQRYRGNNNNRRRRGRGRGNRDN